MLCTFILFCLSSASSAFRVVLTPEMPRRGGDGLAPGSSLPAIMSLRGGGDLAPVIVSATAFIGTATGVSMYMGTKSFTKVLAPLLAPLLALSSVVLCFGAATTAHSPTLVPHRFSGSG